MSPEDLEPINVVTVVGAPQETPPGLPTGDEGVRFVQVHDLAGAKDVLPCADVVFMWDFRSRLLQEAWNARRRLRWVHAAAVGVDAILFPQLVNSDVILTNSRGVFDEPLAEYALSLMLAFAKDLPRTLSLQTDRTWQHREPESLQGKRLVVVGLGGIGFAVGRLAASVGMQVVGAARRSHPPAYPFAEIVAVDQLPRLLAEADYIVLAVPLTPETSGLFSRRLLANMRPTARLINLARGAVVDEEALVEALESERIAGAALDVFVTEPLPTDHPLWRTPNTIISPHMSGDVSEATRALVDLFVSNLRRFRTGEPLVNRVDKGLGYVPSDLGRADTHHG